MPSMSTWCKEVDKLNSRECQEIRASINRLLNWSVFADGFEHNLGVIDRLIEHRQAFLNRLIEHRQSFRNTTTKKEV